MTSTFSLLTASAGSGKTYALTEALSAAIERGKADPDGLRPHHIIATTFTKKAAAELVERTQQRLIDDQHHQAASEVEAALIGTVNSIAGRIVEMYAIDAGLSPEVRVLGEDEQARAFAVALDPVIAEAERANRPLLRRTGYDAESEPTGSHYRSGESWVNTVRAVVEKARSNRLGAAELRESRDRSLSDLGGMLDSVDPNVAPGQRERWSQTFRDCLATLKDDIADVEAQGGPANGMKWKSDGASGVKTSFANTCKSIDVLEYFEQRMRTRGVESLTWPQWMAMANLKDLRIPGREHGAIGKRPMTVFAPLSDAILGLETIGNGTGLLGCAEFRDDLRALVTLVFDTAIEGLSRYEEYKNRLGVMDFVDQEALAVDLVTSNDRVRASLGSRYRFLAVDEFQDTSPIQLELFLRLSELVDEVLWVGDPKQSIYGFRGAAPDLMDAVVAEAGRGAAGEGRGVFDGATVRPLRHSYRSSEGPVALVNGLFTSIFEQMPAEDVALDIPESRANERELGGVRLWSRPTKAVLPEGVRSGVTAARSAIATGIASLLAEGLEFKGRPLEPSDIAVLSRTGTGLSDIVEGLRALGIPAVGPERPLSATREGQVIGAALALARDPRDTLALTELVHLLDDHAAHTTWFEQLGECPDRESRRALMATWRDDPALAGLERLRDLSGSLSPAEFMLALTDGLDLPERVKHWSRVDERLDNLDAFHTLARDYETDADNRGRGMSVAGLHDYVVEHAETFRQKHAPNAVLVTTVHQSKGLQWPVVVSIVPDTYKDKARDAVTAQSPAGGVDPLHPLAGRHIMFIPAIKDAFPPMARALASHEALLDARLRAQAEEARIHYVSLTRAKWITVLAPMGAALEKSVLSDFHPETVRMQAAREAAWPGTLDEEPGADGGTSAAGAASPLARVEPSDAETTPGTRASIRVSGARIPDGYPGAEHCSAGVMDLPGVRVDQFVPWEYTPLDGDKANQAAPVPVIGERLNADGTRKPLLPLWADGPVDTDVTDPELDSDELLLEQIVDSDAALYAPDQHEYSVSRGEASQVGGDSRDGSNGAHGDRIHGVGTGSNTGAGTSRGAWRAERSPLASTDTTGLLTPGALVAGKAGAADPLAARFKASAATLEPDTTVTVRMRENLGPALVTHGDRGWELVGEAVHAFLALPLPSMSTDQQNDAATRIADRWLAGAQHLSVRTNWATVLVEAGRRWHTYLERDFAEAQHATEVPVSMWNSDSQVMEGWVDSLIELPGGDTVLVDHKTFPDPDLHAAIEHVRSENAAQLAVYMDAIEQARGARPAAALIHLPLSGFVLEVSIEAAESVSA